MEWKFVKPLENDYLIEEFEADFGITLPSDLRNLLESHNGGFPSRRYFLLPNGEDCAMKHLLSLNRGDRETLWKYNSAENLSAGYVFFANDAFGNLIGLVLKDGSILFADRDTDAIVQIAPNLAAFLDALAEE